MRVALVILDGMPARHVRPSVTPTLCELGSLVVGEAVMTSATYPNHASFITGLSPAAHRIFANFVMADGRVQSAHRVGPAVPTLFDALGSRRAVAVLGDHHLVGVMGARAAAYHWPPDGRIPEGTALDRYGYAADAAVVSQVAAVIDQPWDLLVVHLNEPDTAGHIDSPDSTLAAAAYRSTDAALAQLLTLLEPMWEDLVVIVLSDHDQQSVDTSLPPVDVGIPDLPLIPEGGAAVLFAPWQPALEAVDGIAGYEHIEESVHLLWATPGRLFAVPIELSLRGHHGGVDTRDQVVVVGGGHADAATLARSVAGSRPPATFWAPTIASLLDLHTV